MVRETGESMQPAANSPFEYLFKSIRVLVADDNKSAASSYKKQLQHYPLYDVEFAFDPVTAKSYLLSDLHCHVCLLSIDFENPSIDPFELLSAFSTKSSIILVTDKQDTLLGYKAFQNGAQDIISKAENPKPEAIINKINKCFLINLVNPEYRENEKSSISLVTRAIIDNHPGSIGQWASEIGVTQQYIKNLWKDYFDSRAEHICFLYNLYRNAFQVYNNLFKERKKGIVNSYLFTSDLEYTRHYRHFIDNKNALQAIVEKSTQ
ncbi:MAG: response regulator [Chitinivibrionales bacterium]|nr:response regulator [Chitinivibrionales bacterium]